MLRKPSSRRKSSGHAIELNLVPMMDTFITLIMFILATMAFLNLVSVETPLPTASPTQVAEKLKEKPLQLTVSLREKDAEIWSPFQKIPSQTVKHLPEGSPDFRAIHEALVKIKQKFPNEMKIVIAPSGAINYEILVAAMDSMRLLEATDPPLFVKNPQTGIDEATKFLFPEVIFGNILGQD